MYNAQDYQDLLPFSVRATRLDAIAKAIPRDLAHVRAMEAAASLPWPRRVLATTFNRARMKGAYNAEERCLLYAVGPTASAQVTESGSIKEVVAVEGMAAARLQAVCDAPNVNRSMDFMNEAGLEYICVSVDRPAQRAKPGLTLVRG